MKMLGRVTMATMLVIGAWTMAGCEDHTIGGELVDTVKGHDSDKDGESQGKTTQTKKDVSGTWHGKAGSGQGATTLRLQQDGTSLSGSWTWGAGDTRSCSGYRDGMTIYLWDKGAAGDSWQMTLSGDGSQMYGSAKKYGGGSYALSFSR